MQLLTKAGALSVPEWYNAGKVSIESSDIPFGEVGPYLSVCLATTHSAASEASPRWRLSERRQQALEVVACIIIVHRDAVRRVCNAASSPSPPRPSPPRRRSAGRPADHVRLR